MTRHLPSEIRTLLAAAVLLAANTGCVSYLAMDHASRDMAEARQRKAIALGASPDEAFLAVDVTALDYIKEHPGLALGAAVLDGAMLYGTYWLAREVQDGNDGPDAPTVTVNAGGDAQVNVGGNTASSDNEQGDRPTTTTSTETRLP